MKDPKAHQRLEKCERVISLWFYQHKCPFFTFHTAISSIVVININNCLKVSEYFSLSEKS